VDNKHCGNNSERSEWAQVERVLEALIEQQEWIMSELDVEEAAQVDLSAALDAEMAELAKLSTELSRLAEANAQVVAPGAVLAIATSLTAMSNRLKGSTAAAVAADPTPAPAPTPAPVPDPTPAPTVTPSV